jgi:Ras-related GTP-binding protein C/D
MSKVISKLVAERLPHLGNMMNDLYSNCNLDKVYLFDMVTKIFFCTDYVPLNMDNFSLCADMLDVYMDFSCIYGDKPEEPHDEGKNGEDSNWEPYEQVIRMTDKKILFLQQIQGHVTLVCNFNEDYMDRKGVIEYNIKVFRQTWDKMITKQCGDTKGKTASKF